ncbi:MAG: hypothetical protein SO016_12700 [Lachnospiraceae bacterium]|nr:hypothetical protein [Robinsoniella sp.]MDY3767523.1 hypothetical protein [Lachnospiraceae bacterium]
MIREYIEEKKKENIQRKQELEKKYNKLIEEEKEIKLKISKMKEESQLEYDIFSPRSFRRMERTQIYDLEETLKNVILNKQELKRQIREKDKMQQKLEKMEEEMEASECIEEEIEEKVQLSKEKVEEIVKILDECLRLMYNDRNTCKSELKQVKMYLKSFVRK